MWDALRSNKRPSPNKKPPAQTGDSFIRTEALLLLLTFSVSLLALLAGILRMLLSVGGMFLALYVVAFSVLFSRGAMGLGGILVKFSCLIVSVFRHWIPPVSVG
jgi:hypothetical protein